MNAITNYYSLFELVQSLFIEPFVGQISTEDSDNVLIVEAKKRHYESIALGNAMIELDREMSRRW